MSEMVERLGEAVIEVVARMIEAYPLASRERIVEAAHRAVASIKPGATVESLMDTLKAEMAEALRHDPLIDVRAAGSELHVVVYDVDQNKDPN